MVQRCLLFAPADLSGGSTRCQGPHDCFYFEPSAALKGRDFLWKLWKTRFRCGLLRANINQSQQSWSLIHFWGRWAASCQDPGDDFRDPSKAACFQSHLHLQFESSGCQWMPVVRASWNFGKLGKLMLRNWCFCRQATFSAIAQNMGWLGCWLAGPATSTRSNLDELVSWLEHRGWNRGCGTHTSAEVLPHSDF